MIRFLTILLLGLITIALGFFAACGGGGDDDDDDDDDSTYSDDDSTSDEDAGDDSADDDIVDDDAGDDDATDDDADDDSAPTYENFAKGFFENYCTRCHIEPLDNAPMPLTTYDEVKDILSLIRMRVVIFQDMPPSAPLPPSDEITKFRQWIDAGGPEN